MGLICAARHETAPLRALGGAALHTVATVLCIASKLYLAI